MMMKRICHMTSAHPWNDIRIFVKECQSLASAGYEVFLVCEGIDREDSGVHIVGCGKKPSSRRERMRGFAKKVYERAVGLNCDIYHFHDPELLPYGVKLKRLGKKVVFDSHEDVPGQILDKEWLPFPVRKIVSVVYKIYETNCVKQFDAVVTATPHIAELFEGRARKIMDINNFPKLDDIVFHEKDFNERENIVCYAGGINELRGEKIMLDSMRDMDCKLIMAGDYNENEVFLNKPNNVTYLGRINRAEINELYGKAIAGLVLLMPNPNYYWSRPIKMYEYMAAGLPFICSDFPLWKKVVEKTGAGICVSIDNIGEVKAAIDYLMTHREEAQQMGRRGRRYVVEEYNWSIEEAKLLKLYKQL